MRPEPPRRPAPGEPLTLAQRAGCFFFVAAPLVFGVPVASAYAAVLGGWVVPLYAGLCLLLLITMVYLLERQPRE